MLSGETEKAAVAPSTLTAPGISAVQYVLLPLAGPEEFDLEVCIEEIHKQILNTSRISSASILHYNSYPIQRNVKAMMYYARHTSRLCSCYALPAMEEIDFAVKAYTRSFAQRICQRRWKRYSITTTVAPFRCAVTPLVPSGR